MNEIEQIEKNANISSMLNIRLLVLSSLDKNHAKSIRRSSDNLKMSFNSGNEKGPAIKLGLELSNLQTTSHKNRYC